MPAAQGLSVLHLSHFDEYGGAGRSSYRLHEGLRRLGVRSRMIVGAKSSSDSDVDQHSKTFADRIANRLGFELGIQYAYLPSSRTLVRHPWIREADVIQLANVHGGWIDLRSLPRLARGKRTVWCLHDMWSFTGHCGYSYGHEGWLTGCGSCPHLDSYPPVRRDATRLNVKLKRRVYSRLELDVVAPSNWLAGLARRSPLLGRFPVHVIPYGIDTDAFAPLDRAAARAKLGLPADELLVLVVAIEPRKGSDLLGPLLPVAERAAGRELTLAIAGDTAQGDLPEGARVRLLGNLDENGMRLAYCAADAYLLPTRHDNLPNTLLEALACGAAVVASEVGGIPDVIDDGVNGLLAELDPEALGTALGRVLADAGLATRLGAEARRRAERDLALEVQARAYLALYDR